MVHFHLLIRNNEGPNSQMSSMLLRAMLRVIFNYVLRYFLTIRKSTHNKMSAVKKASDHIVVNMLSCVPIFLQLMNCMILTEVRFCGYIPNEPLFFAAYDLVMM